jgi:hypothetical protein
VAKEGFDHRAGHLVMHSLEAELGDEQSSFIEGDSREWELLPLPEGFFKVGIDGAYVRNWLDKKGIR